MARVGCIQTDARTEGCSYADHDLSAKQDALLGKIPVTADSTSAVRLIQQIANQDREAFSRFYDRFSTLVFTLAMRMLKARSDAENLLQEVFVQIWRQAENYSPERGSPEAWIINIARSRAIDKIRAIRKMGRSVPAADPLRAQFGEKVESSVVESDVRIAMNGALANLSEAQRKLMEMAYLDGLTQTEIAERLAEPLGTVRNKMRTGIQRLREIVSSR